MPFAPKTHLHKDCPRPECKRARESAKRQRTVKPCQYPGCERMAPLGTSKYCSEAHRVNAYKALNAAARREGRASRADMLQVPVWPTVCQCGARTYIGTNGDGVPVCVCPNCRVVVAKEFPDGGAS